MNPHGLASIGLPQLLFLFFLGILLFGVSRLHR
jgi:Sec-independent protein translocase protein TatA